MGTLPCFRLQPLHPAGSQWPLRVGEGPKPSRRALLPTLVAPALAAPRPAPHQQRRGDGEGPRPDQGDEVQQVVRGDGASRVWEVAQHLAETASGGLRLERPHTPARPPAPARTSRTVLRGRVQYSHSSSWPWAELNSSSFSRSSSWQERQAKSSKKERRGTLAMSRYWDTRR